MLASTVASSARWSRDISHQPLNAVTMAGETLTKPVVARTSSRRAASSRNSTADLAAAINASLLTSIGVEPEWACWPVKRTACRSTPKVPSTTPSGRDPLSKAGPLLVGPVHEAQRNGTLLRGEDAHDFEGADHVQGAVEPAPVRDGVYVSAENDGPLGVTGCCGPNVAGLVGLYLGYAFNL